MIYQYLYARKKEGYKQLNDWSDAPFYAEDMVEMESLRTYTLSQGFHTDIPECYYYFRGISSLGNIGIVGKTSYVPQGSSSNSGERETSFVHKYIFTDKDYQNLLLTPNQIFEISKFCTKVEETENYNDKTQDIFIPKELPTPEEMQQLIKDFNITEDDFIHLLYAIMDAAYSISTRVYIPLPSINKESTDKAKRFCERILMALPKVVVSECGFITYSSTFHNATINNIPSAIKIIFFPATESNITKIGTIAEDHYLYFNKYGYNTTFNIEPITYRFLKQLKDKIILGVENDSLTVFYQLINIRLENNVVFTPEFLGNLKAFYEYYIALRKKTNINFNYMNVIQVFKCFKENRNALSEGIGKDIGFFVDLLLDILCFDHVSLDLLSSIYGFDEQIDNKLVEWLCETMKEENLLIILQHNYSDKNFLPAVYRKLYSTSKYYGFASTIVYRNICARKEEGISNRDLIIQLFQAIDKLYLNYEGLVKSPEYIKRIDEYLHDKLFNKGVFKNYEDMSALITSISEFENNHKEIGGAYLKLLMTIMEEAIEGVGLIDEKLLAEIYTWDKEYLNQIKSEKAQYIKKRLRTYEFKTLFKSVDNMDMIMFRLIKTKRLELIEMINDVYPAILDFEDVYKENYETKQLEFYNYHAYMLIILMDDSMMKLRNLAKQICDNVIHLEGLSGLMLLYKRIKEFREKPEYRCYEYMTSMMPIQSLFSRTICFQEVPVSLSKKEKYYEYIVKFLREIKVYDFVKVIRDDTTTQDNKKDKNSVQHKNISSYDSKTGIKYDMEIVSDDTVEKKGLINGLIKKKNK